MSKNQVYVFDEVFEDILRKKEIKDKGGFIGIPYPFQTLNDDLGGIEKDCVVGITANSGVSKSKYTRFVYIYNVYNFYVKTGYQVKILYFPLEDSHKDVLHNMICFYLKEKYNMNVSMQHLQQMGEYDLDIYTINKIREARGYFSDLYNILTVIDDAFTVTEILNICKSWANENGTIRQNDQGIVTEYRDLKNVHTIAIIDNLSNIIAEARHKSKHEAIGELAAQVARNTLAKIFKFTVVLVQQQSQSKEKVQYANNGRLLYEKFEPALGDLADNLETQRS